MADNITCNVCGGTDFSKEAGFYYCNECQTQSQDVREQIFALPEETAAATSRQTSSKKIRTEKKSHDQLTSWECYNYIVLGLVNELVELGAKAKLKQTVRLLWFKYLKELEVISDTPKATPKLPAINNEVDAQIIYRRVARKRKRTSRTPSPSGTSSSDPTTVDSQTLRREKSKKRRSMILALYDEFSSTMQSEDVSLHNQSLVSLKAGSDASSKDQEKFLQYSTSARKELLKKMTKNHLKSHCRDVDSILDCHKMTYRSVTSTYRNSAMVLCRSKVYALIYLGLLINKDDIQLGDLLRFIREGCLSYHNVRHFFPDDLDDKHLNIKTWSDGTVMITHHGTREVAAKMAQCLGVTNYVPRQNLMKLCRRYCAELNLPGEVLGYSANLMSRVLPRLNLTAKSKLVPNYEGRVISIIMFVLKLMFGLDGLTEDKFSKFATTANFFPDANFDRMFIWRDWTYYITYRRLVLTQHHFPTQFLYGDENSQNSDLLIDFLTQQNSKHEQDEVLTKEAEILKRLLVKLNDKQFTPSEEPFHFTPSLTPFRNHIQTLLDSTVPSTNDYLIDVLKRDFKNDSLKFLIEPFFYLEKLHPDCRIGVKHKGANNLEMVEIPYYKGLRESWRCAVKKTAVVRLSKRIQVENDGETRAALTEDAAHKLKTRLIVKNFEDRHRSSYRKNAKKLLKLCEKRKKEMTHGEGSHENSAQSDTLTQQSEGSSHVVGQGNNCRRRYIHYLPYERYWLKSVDARNVNKEDFQSFLLTFPESFRLLLNECARVTEQHPKVLFEEFNDVELYFCFVAEFTTKDKYRDHIVNNNLKRFVDKAKNNW